MLHRFDWRQLTLPGQFLLAGAVVMVVAMTIVGSFVSRKIESAVVQNSAISAAHFVESFISPLAQELAETDTLSAPARQALIEVFQGATLSERIVSFKLWLPGGFVAYSTDTDIIGKTFEPSSDQKTAWLGIIASSFQNLNDIEDQAEAALQMPLLEVYSPIHQDWTGEVIAVAEFYARGDALASNLKQARRSGWLIVGGIFLTSGMLLFGIVQAGGRTIRQQREALEKQLIQTEKVARQNAELRQRSVLASSRATAQTERAIRRIGADLHDGPAQYLALAALRMDSALTKSTTSATEVAQVRDSLDKALAELRLISRGLALPDLDQLAVCDVIGRAVRDHEKQTDMTVSLTLPDRAGPELDYAQKLCVFRFLQEALSNATRHAKVNHVDVTVDQSDQKFVISVADQGPGFDATAPLKIKPDGGQGLRGLMDRAESIGGTVRIDSRPGSGCVLTLNLPIEGGPK